MAGRVLDAGLDLLDRQLLDRDGVMCGNVDDLEITVIGGVPVVTAVLTGPQALGWRLGGRVGVLVTALGRVLHPSSEPAPARVSWGLVSDVASSVRLAASAEDLDTTRFERWVRTHVIDPIPGASHDPGS